MIILAIRLHSKRDVRSSDLMTAWGESFTCRICQKVIWILSEGSTISCLSPKSKGKFKFNTQTHIDSKLNILFYTYRLCLKQDRFSYSKIHINAWGWKRNCWCITISYKFSLASTLIKTWDAVSIHRTGTVLIDVDNYL